MRDRKFSVILLAWIIIACFEAVTMASSWYVVKDSGNENIKYFKDENGDYSPDNWAEAQPAGTLSGLLNSGNISSGDTIYLSCGNYLLGSTITLGKAVSIYGGFSGIEQTIDDRKNSNNRTILDGQDANLVLAIIKADAALDGLTITHGSSDYGGGISISASSPKISNCIISDNSASGGGGFYISGRSAPVITNCSITGNSAANNGGGLHITISSTITITDCSITNNTASSGGGIYAEGSKNSLNLTNCTIAGNKASLNGAGISQSQSCTLNLQNCTIANNLSAKDGLELYNNSSTSNLTNSIIWNENAQKSISQEGAAHLVKLSCTNCALPSTITTGTNTITLDTWNSPKSSDVTVNGVTHTVYAIADNPGLKPLLAAGTSTNAPETDQLGIVRRLPPSIGAVEGAGTYYVEKSGDGEGINYLKTSGEYDASHWAEASVNGTLSAFMKGSVSGDTVYVGAGTYTLAETLELGRNVHLFGGFAGTEESVDDRNSSSVIDGNGSVQIINITSASKVDGFSMKDAKDSALNISGSPAITNCAISGSSGEGVYISSGSPQFMNCTVSSSTGNGLHIISGTPSFTNCTVTGNSAGVLCESEAAFMNCSIVGNTSNVFGASSLTNSLVSDSSSGTGIFGNCALPEGFTPENAADSVHVSSGWTPVPSSSAVRGVTHTVFTLQDNPALSVLPSAGTSTGAPAADILGTARLNPPTIGTLEYPYDSSYLLSIPDSLSITGAGWNAAAGGITVKHDPASAGRTFTPVKKLNISAVSSNDWKLKSEHEQTIAYTLKSSDAGTAVTSWEFSPDDINADGGTAKTLGADIEDYTGKPAGEYTDTLTFSVNIEDK